MVKIKKGIEGKSLQHLDTFLKKNEIKIIFKAKNYITISIPKETASIIKNILSLEKIGKIHCLKEEEKNHAPVPEHACIIH